MGLGLAITGLVAVLVAATPAIHQTIFGTPTNWLAIFAPLGFALLLCFRIERIPVASALTAFAAFSAAMGISLPEHLPRLHGDEHRQHVLHLSIDVPRR
jgi:uncharacterized protein